MGAGTARGGACLLISGKCEKKLWNLLYLAGVLLLLFIFMIVQELIQTKNSGKIFSRSIFVKITERTTEGIFTGAVCKTGQLSGTA